jgi:hypothetical protein
MIPPSLIEVANELVHAIFVPQGVYQLNAIFGIAKDRHLAVDVLVAHPLDASEHLPEHLEALDVAMADRPQPLGSFAQEAQQSGLNVLLCLCAARRDMY